MRRNWQKWGVVLALVLGIPTVFLQVLDAIDRFTKEEPGIVVVATAQQIPIGSGLIGDDAACRSSEPQERFAILDVLIMNAEESFILNEVRIRVLEGESWEIPPESIPAGSPPPLEDIYCLGIADEDGQFTGEFQLVELRRTIPRHEDDRFGIALIPARDASSGSLFALWESELTLRVEFLDDEGNLIGARNVTVDFRWEKGL